MKRKQKQPTDGVVAARLPINELEALKLAAQAEKRNVGNMIRVMIAEGVAARKNKANEIQPILRWLKSAWYAHLRGIDIMILWPSLRRDAEDIEHARAAFSLHAFHDHAWLHLGEDRIKEFIDSLE